MKIGRSGGPQVNEPSCNPATDRSSTKNTEKENATTFGEVLAEQQTARQPSIRSPDLTAASAELKALAAKLSRGEIDRKEAASSLIEIIVAKRCGNLTAAHRQKLSQALSVMLAEDPLLMAAMRKLEVPQALASGNDD